MFDARRKLLVLLAALLAGGIAFASLVLLEPEMLNVYDQDSARRLLSTYALVEAFTFAVFVATSVAIWVARRMEVCGFDSRSPEICTLIASMPLIMVGPMVAASYLFDELYWKATIHVFIVVGVLLRIIVLGGRLAVDAQRASRGIPN